MSYSPSDPASGSSPEGSSPPPDHGQAPPPPPGYDPAQHYGGHGYGQAPLPPPPGYGPPPAYGQAPPPPPPGYGGYYGSQPDPAASVPPPGYGAPSGYYGAPEGWGGPRLASWGQRVLAFLVDVLAAIGIGVGVAILAAVASAVSDALAATVVVLGYLGVLAFQVWNQGVRQGRTGQSIGKQQMGLRVLGEQTGQPLGAGMGFVRYLCHAVIGGACFLDYLWPLWDAKRQTLTDKIVKTVVVAE